MIKKNFFTASMPTESLSDLSIDCKRNLEKLVKVYKLANFEITALLMEVS